MTTTRGMPLKKQNIMSLSVLRQNKLFLKKSSLQKTKQELVQVTNQSRTPSNKSYLDHKAGDVGVEHLDEGQIHVDSFQCHPGKGRQEEIMQEKSSGDAKTHGIWVQSQPSVQ